MKYKTSIEQQTIKLGEKIAKQLSGGEILLLQGELGSGKTIFVKGLAKGLGIRKIVTSPTFVLFKVYPVKNNKKIKQLVHVDCYRLKDGREVMEAGLEDYLFRPDTVTVVEWGNKIKKFVNDYQEVKFKIIDNKREIEIWKTKN